MATSTGTLVEQRQAPRVLFRDLKITYDGLTDSVDTRAPDLSISGMFINTPRFYPAGAQLKLKFDLVRTRVTVWALGEVCYCLYGVGIGVKFVNLPRHTRVAIERELEEMKKAEARSQK